MATAQGGELASSHGCGTQERSSFADRSVNALVESQAAHGQQYRLGRRMLRARARRESRITRSRWRIDAVAIELNSPRYRRGQGSARGAIAPVGNYQTDALADRAVCRRHRRACERAGWHGCIKVAVLDSGIDYLHAALGGSGNPADFAANNPDIIEPGTFPTAKVVGGYDFVGSNWTGAAGSPPEAPDPDPLDAGPGRGHGTHVAHIIAGKGGVAPGASLYAVKVCSSVSTSCSGIALIQGMDFALDPNGDGDTSDAVDIINMSLGLDYGQPSTTIFPLRSRMPRHWAS